MGELGLFRLPNSTQTQHLYTLQFEHSTKIAIVKIKRPMLHLRSLDNRPLLPLYIRVIVVASPTPPVQDHQAYGVTSNMKIRVNEGKLLFDKHCWSIKHGGPDV